MFFDNCCLFVGFSMAYLISWSSGDGGRTFHWMATILSFLKKRIRKTFLIHFFKPNSSMCRDSRFNRWVDKWPVVNNHILGSQLLNYPPNSFIVTFKTLFSLISISCSLSEFNGQSVAKSFGFFHGHRHGHRHVHRHGPAAVYGSLNPFLWIAIFRWICFLFLWKTEWRFRRASFSLFLDSFFSTSFLPFFISQIPAAQCSDNDKNTDF